MGLKPDHKYTGTVGPQSQLMTTQMGTLGYQVMLSCEDGDTSFTIWLTDKNRKKAFQYFGVLGVDPEKLKSRTYFELQLAMDIEGREVSFGTKEEEYNGKRSIKVAWIGKKTSDDAFAAAADFFGQPEKPGNGGGIGSIPDEEIPF